MDIGGAGERAGAGPETVPQRCAECGRSRADRSLPRPRTLLHWRRTAPLLVMLAVAGVIAIMASRGVVTLRSGTGRFVAQLTDPPTTWAQVQRLAAAGADAPIDETGRGLLHGVLDVAASRWWTGPFPLELHVGFTDPAATQSGEVERRGWPVHWHQRATTRRTDPLVTDPSRPPVDGFGVSIDATGTVAPRQRWEWLQSRVLHAPPPEETGGALVRTIIHPSAIALPVAMAWTLALLGLAVLAVLERVRRRELPPRGRRLAIRGMLVMLVILVGASLFVGGTERWRSVDRFASGPTRPTPMSTVPTAVDLDGLADLAAEDEPAAVRHLAGAIVDAMANAGDPAEDEEFALRIDMRGRSMTVGHRIERPLPIASWGATTWIDGTNPGAPVLAAPAGTHVQLRQGFLVVERSDGDPATPSSNFTLLLVESGLILAILLAAGGTTALATGLLPRRRAARRRREDRCVACGHAFAPGPPPPPTPAG